MFRPQCRQAPAFPGLGRCSALRRETALRRAALRALPVVREVGEWLRRIGSGGNAMEILSWLMGLTNVLVRLLEAPDVIHAAMDRITAHFETVTRRVLELADGRIDAVFCADDLGTQRGPEVRQATVRPHRPWTAVSPAVPMRREGQGHYPCASSSPGALSEWQDREGISNPSRLVAPCLDGPDEEEHPAPDVRLQRLVQ